MDHVEYTAHLRIERVTRRVKKVTGLRTRTAGDPPTEHIVQDRSEVAAFTLCDPDLGSLSSRVQAVMTAGLPGPGVMGQPDVEDDDDEEEETR